jgi:hypothetical protein
MRWFFQEWIYGRGWPEYAYTWGWGADTLRVTIWQVQKDPTWPVFAMPVQLRATFASGDTVLTVRDSLRVQEFAVGVPRQPVGLEFDPFNRILKRMAGPVTGVRPESLPGRMALDQNFPNPFNSSTSIVYEVSGFRDQASGAGSQLPLAGRVKLAVYDLLGREVVVLVDQEMQPGRYTVKFSARGGSASGGDGSALASGVYIYRLTAGGSTVNRKMILMR